MRVLLFTLVFGASVAMAQVVTTTPIVTPVAVTPAICPAAAAIPGTVCPAIIAQNIQGDTVLLVLGQEERFVFENVPIRHVGWRGTPLGYSSYFELDNPITHSQVNGPVSRHGNPFYPYYQVGPQSLVAGLQERFVLSTSLTAQDQAVLQSVTVRYRGLTPAQAQLLGYEPVGAFVPGQGQVYVNRALVDARYDPQLPEAFIFNQQGQVVGVQYHVVSAQQITLFGQRTGTSVFVPGAQQVNVWLFTTNPSGLFAAQNPNLR